MKYNRVWAVLALFLLIVLVVGMLPTATAAAAPNTIYVSTSGDDAATGQEAAPVATLNRAYAAVEDGGTIVLQSDLELHEKLVFDQDKAVHLDGNGHSATYAGAATIAPDRYGLLTVNAGSVELANVTFQLPTIPGPNGRVLYVGPSGAVSLLDGAILANGYLGYSGGGVLVAGGNFTMTAGSEIRNCYVANNTTAYGGGVLVSSGTFSMTGGKIVDNTIHTTQGYANYGGGVAVLGGTVHLTGGEISDNQADTAAGGVYLGSGGSLELSGSVSILGNTADGDLSNLYLPTTEVTFTQAASATGKVGISHGEGDYGVIIGCPGVIVTADEAAYTYDTGAYDVRLKDGNLVLYKWTVGVKFIGDNFTADFANIETPKGEDFQTTLTPSDGYVMPGTVTITVDGVELGADEYSYDPDTGRIQIPGEKVTGNISLVVMPNELHTITVNPDHVELDKDTVEVIQTDTTVITFTAMSRYGLPEAVTVTGQCEYSYDAATGKLVISQVAGDVVVAASGSEIPHTIMLNPAQGTVEPTQVVVNESQSTIGALPIPEREGYTFTGWFTASGYKVTASTDNNLVADLKLTAHWSANTNIRYVLQHWVELLDSGANPGYVAGDTLVQWTDWQGEGHMYYLYTLAFYDDGHANGTKDIAALLLTELDGLERQGLTPSGANAYTVTVAPDSSSVFPLFYNRRHLTVTFDANGGIVPQGEAKSEVLHGGLYGALPIAHRAGYTMDGWYTDPIGGTEITADQVFLGVSDVTVYAHWRTTGDTSYTVTHMTQRLKDNLVGYEKTADNYDIYLVDTPKGEADTTADVYALALPGYSPSEANTYQVEIKADGTANIYLYYDRKITTLEYNANGGALAAPGLRTLIYYGGTVSSLSTAPSRSGYTFQGWYLTPAETAKKVAVGNLAADLDPVGGQTVTLYAHWEKIPVLSRPSGGGSTRPVIGGGSGSKITGDHQAYVTGYVDGTFRPSGALARCEAVAIFARVSQGYAQENTYAVPAFLDVPADAWYSNYLGYCVEQGIITGYVDGTFRPYDSITREEFAAMAARYLGLDNVGSAPFEDVPAEHWAVGYIGQLAARGILVGVSVNDAKFIPSAPIDRASTVKIVNQILNRHTAASMIPGAAADTFNDVASTAWYYGEVMEAAIDHEYSRSTPSGEETWSTWQEGR